MALSIISVCRVSKDQDFINGLKRRLLSIARIHPNSPANYPALYLAKTKTMRLLPDCTLGLNTNRIFPNYSKTVHHLVKRNLTCSATMRARNFGKKSDVPSNRSELQIYKETNYGNDNSMENQVERLKRKGAMKDIKVKTPEAIFGLKGYSE